MKKLFLILFAGMVMGSCGGQTDQQGEQESGNKTIEELVQAPMEYEGQTVTFDGIIGHMCEESGDKMRVHSKDNPDFSILVMLGDHKDQMEYEYEGRDITITGDMTAVLANEDEIALEEEEHECETTEAAIQKLEEQGVDPDIWAVVELKDFQLQ
ncbi:MAG: hypothetical protein ACLFMU_02190 [Bacteroidales bacterium]